MNGKRGETVGSPLRATPLRVLAGLVAVVHPFPVAVVVGTSVALLLIAHRGIPGANLLVRASVAVLLSQMAVGALNDVVDRHHDELTQPNKPIVRGLVTPALALGLTGASLLALVPLAWSFGPLPFCYIAVGTAAGLAYDLWLKPTVFSVVGYLVGFMALITWIWTVAGHFTPTFFVVYPAGALLLCAAHLAQSFPDIESDLSTGRRGLATRLGVSITFWAIVVPVLAMAFGGLVLSVLVASRSGAALNLAALLLAVPVIALHQRALQDRRTRVVVFRFIAPSIAATVLGSLLALSV